MKKVIPYIISFLFIFVILLGACATPAVSPTITIPLPSPVVPVDSSEQPTENLFPTTEPSETPTPPTPAPSPIPPTSTQPMPPVTASTNGPVGFIVDPQDGLGLTLHTLDGSLITEVLAPGLLAAGPQFMHFTGPWTGDLNDAPVAYISTAGQSYRPKEAWLRTVAGDFDSLSIQISNLFSIAGAPAQPVLAYSTLDFNENQPRSRLYAANLSTLPGASPLFVIADPDGYIVRVLAVDAESGNLKGVWYTMSAWEIGGELIFEPRKGLKYLDMTTGTLSEILKRDRIAWDVSLDRKWIAYSTISGPISLLNRLNEDIVTCPLLPESNHGAGDACLSPEGQSVAWLEARGWAMAEGQDFSITLRTATTAGLSLANIPQTAFDYIASADKITWIEPVGWLNEQVLIVQALFEDKNHAALMRINIDGSNPLFLAAGIFVAFLYP